MASSVKSLSLSLLFVVALVSGYPTNKDVDESKMLHSLLPLSRAGGPAREAAAEAITPLLALSPETPLHAEEVQPESLRPRRESEVTQPADMLAEPSEPKQQASAPAADMLAEPSEPEESDTEDEPVADSQNFFPAFSPIFSPPLGHSRPAYYHEPVYNARAAYKPHDSFGFGSGTFRDYSFPQAPAVETERSASVLGSGNFGVIRGGTFFAGEGDDVHDDIYGSYYSGNNGHGRPSFYPANPLPTFRQGQDFFANFKDFAEITTPTKSSFSEFYVVYVNPNSTSAKVTHHADMRPHGSAPKNIFEQLQSLDDAPSTEPPQKKVSKSKLKLDKYKTHHSTKEVSKKQKFHASPKELFEPLLALS